MPVIDAYPKCHAPDCNVPLVIDIQQEDKCKMLRFTFYKKKLWFKFLRTVIMQNCRN
jgi:hypothetical protein